MTENEIKEPEAEFGDAFAEATSPEPSDTGVTAPEEAPAAPAPKEEPAAPKGKDAAPNLVQMNRDDRCIDSLHDSLQPALEFEHLPDSGDPTFGEDADELTVLNRFPRFGKW